jgi:hypothetical protein
LAITIAFSRHDKVDMEPIFENRPSHRIKNLGYKYADNISSQYSSNSRIL